MFRTFIDKDGNDTSSHGSAPPDESARATHSGGPGASVIPLTTSATRKFAQSALLRIHCQECDGRGVYSIVNSMDPSARLYDCEACGGDGQARCSECDAVAVEIYSHVSRGQRFDHPVCGTHLAEWLEDEAELAA